MTRVSFWVDKELKEGLVKIARSRDRSPSQMMRKILAVGVTHLREEAAAKSLKPARKAKARA